MPERHHAHVSHCLDILLQALTCTPSLDLVHHQWMETQRNPFPDFSIKRQCLKHDKILEWQKHVGLTKVFAERGGIEKPVGVKQIPPEPELLVIGEDQGS